MDPLRLVGLTVRQLRAFCAVARLLSYTRAAEELDCQQPTVSALIAQVEKVTHLTLFEQNGKRLSLTDEGRELYAHAQDVVEAADDLQVAAAELRGAGAAAAPSLRIAADTTVGTYVLPGVAGAFRRQHPDIALNLAVANRAGVRARLLAHEADLVVAGRPPSADGLAVEPFLRNELVAVAAPGHALAGRAAVPLDELAGASFLLREEGSGTRAAIEELFEVAGLPLTAGMVLGHIEAIKQAVVAGLGVSVLSKAAVRRELRRGDLVVLDVAGLPLQRRWYVARLAAHPLSPGAAAFLEFLRAYRDRSGG
jgi:DNA-binding transcriptional LysR family regulator